MLTSRKTRATRPPSQQGRGNKLNQCTPRRSPHGQTLLAATPALTPVPTPDYAPFVAEIQRLQSVLAAQNGSPYHAPHFDMPVDLQLQQATLLSSARPREFYCRLDEWNNTHHGATCKIMESNTAYTHGMKIATVPDNTGGNPKFGVPVHLHRPRLLECTTMCGN